MRLQSLLIAVLALTATAWAANCADWNTRAFFETATLAEVRGCLAAEAEVDARSEDGSTPLHLAALRTANPAVVAALVDAGADVNARDEGGDTPLHYAVFTDTPAVITALVESGAWVNARDMDGRTPLHSAAGSNDSPAVVTTLIAAGAWVNTRDDDGKTPPAHCGPQHRHPRRHRGAAHRRRRRRCSRQGWHHPLGLCSDQRSPQRYGGLPAAECG